MDEKKRNGILLVAVIGAMVVAVVLVLGTLWMGQNAREDTEQAVKSVSLLYLDELAGRREQVIASNLSANIENMKVAVGLIDEEDLVDLEHLQAFQSRMKELYGLEKFAFVDSNGLIYTSQGTQNNVEQYDFDYKTISKPEISVKNLNRRNKKVVIAIPIDNLEVEGNPLVVCFE